VSQSGFTPATTSGTLAVAKNLHGEETHPLPLSRGELFCVVLIYWYSNTHKPNKMGNIYGLKAIIFVKKWHKNSEK
jgi:hypothetical protein